eukprot:gene7850-biopygen8415
MIFQDLNCVGSDKVCPPPESGPRHRPSSHPATHRPSFRRVRGGGGRWWQRRAAAAAAAAGGRRAGGGVGHRFSQSSGTGRVISARCIGGADGAAERAPDQLPRAPRRAPLRWMAGSTRARRLRGTKMGRGDGGE